MTTAWIVEQIDQQIAKLNEAKSLLLQAENRDGQVVAPKSKKPAKRAKHRMSAAGRAAIAAAQKARWAKLSKTKKQTSLAAK